MKPLSDKDLSKIRAFQRDEITEHIIYEKLSKIVKNKENKEVLKNLSKNEHEHYIFWKNYSKTDVKPNYRKVFLYVIVTRLFGLTFGVRLMENGEKDAYENYMEMASVIPDAKKIADDEDSHEEELIDMINEKNLQFMGSVVLGLNDALVELTGALAGFSLALQNTRLIAFVGLITGVAAAMSMAASEYLSTKSEGNEDDALKASLFTGLAYIGTVILLILPYFIFIHYLVCLAGTIIIGVIVIFVFNFYLAIARNLDFKKRFLEMLIISMGVASISFLMGYIVREFFGLDI